MKNSKSNTKFSVAAIFLRRPSLRYINQQYDQFQQIEALKSKEFSIAMECPSVQKYYL